MSRQTFHVNSREVFGSAHLIGIWTGPYNDANISETDNISPHDAERVGRVYYTDFWFLVKRTIAILSQYYSENSSIQYALKFINPNCNWFVEVRFVINTPWIAPYFSSACDIAKRTPTREASFRSATGAYIRRQRVLTIESLSTRTKCNWKGKNRTER